MSTEDMLRLFVDEGLSYAQIGERAGVSKAAVKNRLDRAGYGDAMETRRVASLRKDILARVDLDRCGRCGQETTIRVERIDGRSSRIVLCCETCLDEFAGFPVHNDDLEREGAAAVIERGIEYYGL